MGFGGLGEVASSEQSSKASKARCVGARQQANGAYGGNAGLDETTGLDWTN